METIILQTKLYIPSNRLNLVPRPHLITKLAENQPCKLILLSAPAGYGKTTLITEWIEQSQGETAVCWLSLDKDDNDPHQFFTYLNAMIQPLPNHQTTLSQLLQSPQPPSTKKRMSAFINDLITVSTPTYLILDDYHTIESFEIDEAITFLLDHIPPHITLIITSRTDPAFPLARLRARGEMSELRANDLRFSENEVAQFLQKSMNLPLSAEQITTLETRTEGWIAGLQMAALSMQGHINTSINNFITAFTGSHRFILDYLIEEVMQSQPTHIRNFLLKTSRFERLCGSLCDAITEENDGQAILEHLERSNMFVVPLDDKRQWYRYHHLFADVLQARLIEEQPDSIQTLHQRASKWYEQNKSPTNAIHHAIAAKDFPRVANLLEHIWPSMDKTFQSNRWLNWATTIPDTTIHTRPVLTVAYAWALLNRGELDTAKVQLQKAEQQLNTLKTEPDTKSTDIIVVDKEQFHYLPASITTAHTYLALALDDVTNAVHYGQQALNLLPQTDYLRRGPAAALLGLVHWKNGDLESAHQALSEAMLGFEKSGNIIFAISGTYGLADIRVAQGRLHEAITTYKNSLQLAQAQGNPPIAGTADLYLGLSKLYYEQGKLNLARQNLTQSETLGEQAALADWPYRLRLFQAQLKTKEHDLDGAMVLLDEAEQLYFSTPVPNIRPIAAQKANLWLAQGQLKQALAWARTCGLSTKDNISYLHEFEFMTLARVYLAHYKSGQADQAIYEVLKLLKRLLQAAKDGNRTGSLIKILVLQALASDAQGDIPTAQASLQQALTLAEPEGYMQIFVEEGEPMVRLLATHTVTTTYTKQLLSALKAEGHTTPSNTMPSPTQTPNTKVPLADPLSQRELEILTLIADGLKNKEIATHLVISLNTVLYHNKNIYSKLGVNKRTLAITKAKKLNLI